MHATLPLLEQTDFPQINRSHLETLQVNLGYLCNQQCLHCHVGASPKRKEIMSKETIDAVLAYLRSTPSIRRLDLTGGAPEMNPHFRYLVEKASALNIQIMDRCNLTILLEQEQTGLAEFLAQHNVEIIASLPCYLEDNVNNQRGKGVFSASIEALQLLNRLGYGQNTSKLTLNLVYNPQGPNLPPPQQELEASYKKHLKETYNISFNQLFTLANMPIQRFGSTLISKGQFDHYMSLLKHHHLAENLKGVMCRSLVNIDWQGYAYDCDFNQMLNLTLKTASHNKIHIKELIHHNLNHNPIVTKDHCYGCTAGQGSSCGGALN